MSDTMEMLLFIILLTVEIIKYICREQRKRKIARINMGEIDRMDGRKFEFYAAEMLTYDGFKRVQVTKSSGDYGVDVIAYKGGHKWAFQCKRHSKNLGLKPIQEVYAGAKRYKADKAVVFTNVYFTPNARSLAQTLHVELWDRAHLANMIQSKQKNHDAKKAISEIAYPNSNTLESKKAPAYAEKLSTKDTEANSSSVSSPHNTELMSEDELLQLFYPVDDTQNEQKMEMETMSTVIGAGKYTFGEDIPAGKYDLKVLSGKGILKIQLNTENIYHEWHNMGIATKGCAESYKGLSLPSGWSFSLSGDLKVEIAKSKMIKID